MSTREGATVTRNDRPIAVIVSPDDLAELEETLTVLNDPDALGDFREADAPPTPSATSSAV